MFQPQKVQTRLQAIEERLARLRAEKDRLLARASKTARRQETRRKIVIGGTLLAALEHEGVPAMRTKAAGGLLSERRTGLVLERRAQSRNACSR